LEVETMADVLIRGLSAQAVARIDEEAAAQGLSRNEYLRRAFDRDLPADRERVVTLEDLRRASDAARDLLDEAVMRDAWG
jgi:hypothetical protein